jgi:hypothetical protein
VVDVGDDGDVAQVHRVPHDWSRRAIACPRTKDQP